MPPKILISFPCDPGNPFYHKSICMTQWKLLQDKRYDLLPIWPCHRPYENNLNKIIIDFLASDCTFWLSMDADNPPINNPLDLVQYNRDIIGLPTPIWHFSGDKKKERPIYWNAYDYVPKEDAYKEHPIKKGLQSVDAIGTGCFLISKRVFLNKNMQRGAFLREYYPDGTVKKGNDIKFCERAKENGFKIFCHYDYPCDHYINLGLNEIVKGFKTLYGDTE